MEQLTKIEYKNGKPEFLVIDGKKLSRFDLLAIASKANDEEIAWNIMNLASRLFHWQDDHTFNRLYGSVAIEITVDNKNNEFSIHRKFNEQVNNYLGSDAKIRKRINDIHHKADSWVSIKGEHIPVEMKLNNFNKKPWNQQLDFWKFLISKKVIVVDFN